MHKRHAAARRTGQQHAVVVEALVGKLTEVTPAADLERRCKPGVVLAAIPPELQFADHEGGIAQTEIQTVAVAGVGIAGTRSGRIAVENGEEQRCVFGKLVFDTRAQCGQRIGRTAARQIDCPDGRPIALQKHLTEIAVKKFGVGRELAKSET